MLLYEIIVQYRHIIPRERNHFGAQLLVQSQKYAPAVDLLKKAQKLKPRENVQRYLEKVEQLARSSGRS